MTLLVGLTGGIGSGKSTVSAQLAARGAILIDYDQLARDVVAPGEPALAAIVERFGADVVDHDGALIRSKLGDIVFGDRGALDDLEAITHPAIRDAVRILESSAGPDDIVIHDNAILIEMGGHERCDVVVVVDVDESVQRQRLVDHRGFTAEQAAARMAQQMSSAERLSYGDIVVDNSRTREELDQQVALLWDRLNDIKNKKNPADHPQG